MVKELAVACGLGVVCELSVARGFGEDTGVADTGNKLGEATLVPNPSDFRAFWSRKETQITYINMNSGLYLKR